ncbi:iron chelate uptake ABC transporter family permease subunit [Streptomyces uncialis]|uniref:FecCD family ABC transporter permease n=1 Tax=Streptomyces uncialis TaxID=1048205 RepID=UPI002E36E74F|nr:iron chelate uptake ABC transporter family permease subunit [Streptomyces uncialis]
MSAVRGRSGVRPVTGRVLRTRSGSLSLRLHARSLAVGTLLALVTCVLGLFCLTTGSYSASSRDVVATLFGGGPAGLGFIVNELRLPRLLVAMMVGTALGLGGAMFQSISRNPLGSPDVVGFTTGSATGALVVILLLGGGLHGVAAGSVVGGLLTAGLVYGLAFRRGVQGFRLILTGIGTTAMLAAFNSYLLTRATLNDAQTAQLWLTGSLNGRRWDHVVPLALALLLLVPVALSLGRRMSLLEMGDDTARARGVPAEPTRLALLVTSVALTAVATAAAGPIAFVALAAPQLARRLTGSPGAGLVPAALMGALLLTAADLATQRALAPTQLPVGIGTAALGGLYLAWLLGREWRRR